MKLTITADEAEKLAEVRRLLGEVNAALKGRGAPAYLCIATGRDGLLCDPHTGGPLVCWTDPDGAVPA